MSSTILKLLKTFCFNSIKYRTYTTDKNVQKAGKIREMNEAKQKRKYSPGTVTLQVLGCGAHGSPASVYLFTDQSRYLFNCGEGTQRLAHEHKTKLSRLQHIFFTGKCWSKLGGLPGLALTAQDAGVTKLTLHGPPELNTLFQAMNRFVVLKKIQIETQNPLNNDFFEDEVMTVRAISIFRSNLENNDSSLKNGPTSTILYVCQLKARPGSLDLKKCVEKGVPPGPLLGLLKNGIDVVLDDGSTVKSSDVSEPTAGDQVIVFIDIPSEDFLSSLNAQFNSYNNASVVIHFTPEIVAYCPLYRQFLSKFGKLTKHIFLNTSNRFSGHFAAHRIQIQLNQLNQQIFPILGEVEHCNTINENTKRTKLISQADNEMVLNGEQLNSTIISNIESLTCFRLRPYKGLDRSMELKLTPDEYVKETLVLERFTDSLQLLKSTLKNKEPNRTDEITPFPKITFLGTGSCIPNKTRNVSGILLESKEDGFMLLDCGEGTLGQIIRFYGSHRWQNVIRNLKAIYVSHLHADHHIGLIGILKERSRLFGTKLPPLYIFAPKQIHSWLTYYNEVIDPIENLYLLIPNGDMVNTSFQSDIMKNIGITALSTCLVRHCAHSFGISITLNKSDEFSEPFKITYSGDTMPCDDLIELGSNSTILIHEATMEDELIDEAKTKMHCTVSQALNVAREMNAKYTILTHFSQRYAKLPRMPDELLSNVAIAFDFMQVTVDDLKDFAYMYPVMKIMFSEHYEEMERKTQMRLLKSERKRKSNS